VASCRISITPCSLAAQSPSRSNALDRAADGKQSGVAAGFRMKIASQPFSSSSCWQRSSPALGLPTSSTTTRLRSRAARGCRDLDRQRGFRDGCRRDRFGRGGQCRIGCPIRLAQRLASIGKTRSALESSRPLELCAHTTGKDRDPRRATTDGRCRVGECNGHRRIERSRDRRKKRDFRDHARPDRRGSPRRRPRYERSFFAARAPTAAGVSFGPAVVRALSRLRT
jgi:hypothetical protein